MALFIFIVNIVLAVLAIAITIHYILKKLQKLNFENIFYCIDYTVATTAITTSNQSNLFNIILNKRNLIIFILISSVVSTVATN